VKSLARAAGLLCLAVAPLAPLAAHASQPLNGAALTAGPTATMTPAPLESPTLTPTEGPQAVSATAASLDAAVSALEASGAPVEPGENLNGDTAAASLSGTAGDALTGTAGALSAPSPVSDTASAVSSTPQAPAEKEWLVAPWDVSAASAVTYTVSVSPEGESADAGPLGAAGPPARRVRLPRLWSESGLEYRFSMGFLHLNNGNALSYMPLELGWRFADGWRLRAGFEAFYYQGRDTDSNTGPTPQLFFYQMTDLRLSAIYAFRRKARLRPLLGLTIESVGALSSYRQINNSEFNSAVISGNDPAHSFEAPGAELGLEYRGGPSWALSWEARYVQGLGFWASMAGTDFGVQYYFF